MSFLALNIASQMMANSRMSLEIIGQNINNSQVKGYSRQEAVQSIDIAYKFAGSGNLTMGLGARISNIIRYRSNYLNENFRFENILTGEFEGKEYYLTEISEAFTDTSEFGIPFMLNDFWGAWNTAAQTPSDIALRKMVIEKGNSLARSIREKVNKINDMKDRLDTEIDGIVSRVNTLLRELASINDQVVTAQGSTYQTNVLLDKRDLMLDELSNLMDIQIVSSEEGSLSIYVDGAPLVSGKQAYELDLQKDASGDFHLMSAQGRELNVRSGKFAGLMDVRNNYLPGYMDEFDEMTTTLIEKVNNFHKYGYGIDGSTGLDFFSGTSASDIQVVLNNPESLALSVPSLTSTSNINVDGEKVSSIVPLINELADFITTPDPGGTGTGKFTVNGIEVTWDLNDTLDNILTRINTLTGIEVKFDSNSQKITLSMPIDSSTITVVDVAGNFGAFTNLSTAITEAGQPGDGLNGIRIFEISTTAVFGNPTPTVTINDKYKNLAALVGFDTQHAISSKNIQMQYLQSIDDLRSSESGVSVDEEVVKLTQYQRIFQAGAKLSNVVDKMFETLISMR